MLRDRAALTAIAVLVAGCSFQITATGDGGTGGEETATLPTVRFRDASGTKDENSGLVTITVELSESATAPVTVPYSFAGSATTGADYSANTGPLVFGVGDRMKTIDVTIVKDTVAEPDEQIVITLGSPTGAELGSDTHTLTISANTLPRVTLSTAASTGNEGDTETITFTLDKAANGPATVNYTVVGVTAQASGTFADFTLASGVVTFPTNSVMQTVSLVTIEDVRNELAETLSITLTTSTAILVDAAAGPTTQVHTIGDDDAVPSLSFTPTMSSVTEGDASTSPATLTVTLSAASGRTVQLAYAVNGAGTTMTDPSDYTLVGSSLTFNEGETTKDITVNVVGDTINEPTETLSVVLSSPIDGSATLANFTRTLTVTDNDPACVGTSPFRICYNSAPVAAVVLPASIDTTNSALCENMQPSQWTGMQNQPTSCVIRGTTISNAGITKVFGTRPLVLVASANIMLETLDVSSQRGGALGAGATTQLGSCTTGAQLPGTGGGGAGGSFQTIGGDGGLGNGGSAPGRAANQVTAPTALRAGCHGQQGEGGDETGKAGGVVYLAAGGAISISGGINASGSSAVGGTTRSGGSGAGSGGMIMLHAVSITVTGTGVIANGAGGASGGDQDTNGRNGNDPDLATPATPAPGGAGGGTGGAGGNGFAGGTAATDGAGTGANNEGGGGGGGGG
ncbi:MAG: hypothetical protein H0T65_18845, partial [Deltaproteobacteria bacterium]|nr:hypothetical protein [Deltaproteobacteria bacterium]